MGRWTIIILLTAVLVLPSVLYSFFCSDQKDSDILIDGTQTITEYAIVNNQNKISVMDQNSVREMVLEEYIAGVVLGEMPAEFEPEALKAQAVVEEVAKLEKLEATKEEVSVACAQIARSNNMTVEQLKPHYNAEFEAAVIKSVLTGKVLDLIRQAAEVTEV